MYLIVLFSSTANNRHYCKTRGRDERQNKVYGEV